MRIAYLTQSYPPMISGATIVAEQLAVEMAERGHQVLVITASDRQEPYFSLQKNLTVLRLKSIYNPWRIGQRFLVYQRTAILNALREFRPGVIHSHDPLQLGWLGIEYARRARIPTTLTIHQLPWFVASYLPGFLRVCIETVLWAYARWLSRNFTSLIVPTPTIATLVSKMTGLKTNVISYGMDLQTFHPPLPADPRPAAPQSWNLPPGVPLLLHVGRLDTDKDVDRVIHAAAPVIRESEAHMLVVGDGRQRNHLMRQCRKLGIAERIHFTGFISKNQGLPDIYRMASVFITASEIETQGIVLLEAAASGLPIVAVNATCIPEIVHNGVNGYLTEPGDIPAMSKAIRSILKDSSISQAMGRASCALAELHNWEASFDKHERMYHMVSSGMMKVGSPSLVARIKERLNWVLNNLVR